LVNINQKSATALVNFKSLDKDPVGRSHFQLQERPPMYT